MSPKIGKHRLDARLPARRGANCHPGPDLINGAQQGRSAAGIDALGILDPKLTSVKMERGGAHPYARGGNEVSLAEFGHCPIRCDDDSPRAHLAPVL